MYNKKFNKLVKAKPEMFDDYDFQKAEGKLSPESEAKILKSLSPLARKLLAKNRGG
jgi:hypothetical protein